MQRLRMFVNVWTILFLVGVVSYTWMRYDREKTRITENVNELLLQASQSVKYLLPEGFQFRAAKYGVNTATDRTNIQKLTDFARERDLRYIYSLARSNTNIIYTASSLNEGESLEAAEARYGVIAADATPLLKKAFNQTGQTVEESEDKWGKYYAVYYCREEGKFKYVSGAEIKSEVYQDKLGVALIESLRDVVFMVFLCTLLVVPFVRRMRRRIRGLSEEVDMSYLRYSKDILQRGK